MRQGDAAAFAHRLRDLGIALPTPASDGLFLLKVNETWAQRTGAALADAFRRAAAG